MLIQPWVLVEQTDHRTDQTQLTTSTAARCHLPQQGTWLLVSAQQQPGRQTRHDQQRDGKQGKQPRPGANGFDACLGKAQPPFRIAKTHIPSDLVVDSWASDGEHH